MDIAKQLEEKEMELLNIQTLIITLEDQVQKVTDKNGELKRREADLEKKVKQLELDLYHASIEKEEEKNQLRQEMAHIQYEGLETELNQKMDELSRCQYQNKILENKLARSEADFQERLEETIAKYSHFETEKQSLQNQLSSQMRELEKVKILQKEVGLAKENITQLMADKQSLEESLGLKSIEYEKERKEWEHASHAFDRERNDLRVRLDNVLVEKRDLENQCANLNHLLEKATAENREHVNAQQNREATKRQHEEIVLQLKKDFHYQTNGLHNEINELKAQLATAKSLAPPAFTKTTKGKKKDRGDDGLEEFMIELAKKEHEIDELMEQIASIEKQNTERERSFNEKESKLNSLLKTTNEEKTKLSRRLDDLHALVEELNGKNKELEDKVKDTETLRRAHVEYTQVKNDLNIWKNKYDELTKEKERLLSHMQNKLDERTNVLEDTQKTLNQKIQQIIDLNKSLQEHQSKLAVHKTVGGISPEELVRKETDLQRRERETDDKYAEVRMKDIKILELEHSLMMLRGTQGNADDKTRVSELERKVIELQAGTNTRDLEKQLLLLQSKLNEKERLLGSINNSKYVKHLESKIQGMEKELDDLKTAKFKFSV